MELDKDLRSRQQVRCLVSRADEAWQTLKGFDQGQIDRIVEAVSRAGADHAAELAELACRETGFGNVPDKTAKNLFAARTVYDAIRGMKTIGILREDKARRTMDVGVPVGVIAALVPSTNPTSTVIYKTMIALKGGNTVVFSPHPNARECTVRTVELLQQAVAAAGCPAGAVGCIDPPTQEALQELMHHPAVRLILATGGPGMVRAAYSSGKPAIGVGAGNGPAYIHKSADIPRAVAQIIASKTFDNGTVCASEQSIILEAPIESRVHAELKAQGGYFLSADEAAQVAALLLRPNGTINPKIVGKTACQIARMAGLTGVPETARVLVAKETQAGPTRPYSREKLCPILALFVEPDEDTVLEKVCQVLENEGSGHTFVMHCTDDAVIRRFALRVPVSRFLVNAPGATGGIGATTNLFPALTLGCGAVGGSSSSNNIGPLDLINIRRVAAGVRDMPENAGHTTDGDFAVSEETLRRLTEKIMKKLL